MKELTFNSCTIIDEKMYFISNFENMIAYLDIENGEISYLDNVKGYEPDFVGSGIEKVIQEGKKIYFFTIGGEKVIIYNIENSNCKIIDIKLNKNAWGNFAFFTKYQREIFIFPSYGDNIIRINTITDEILYEGKLYEELKIDKKYKKFSCGCKTKNTIYLFGNQTFVAYDLLSGKYERQEMEYKELVFIDAINFKNYFYLIDEKGKIYRRNISGNNMEKLIDVDEGEHNKARLISTKKNMWILPALGEEIYILDYDSGLISIYQEYPVNFRYDDISGWSKYLDYCKYENQYYIAMRRCNYVLVIDDETGNGRWIKPIFPKLNNKMKVFSEYKIVHNEGEIRLKEFINAI